MYCVPRYRSCDDLSSDCSIMDIGSCRGQKCSCECSCEELFLLLLASVIALSSRTGLMHLSCRLLISAAWQKRDRPNQVFLAISSAAVVGDAEVHRPDSSSATQPRSFCPPLHMQSSAAECLFFWLKKKCPCH